MACLHDRQTRRLDSPSLLKETRVTLLQRGQTSATLEICSGAGNSIFWPFCPWRRGRVCFTRRLMPSAVTRLSFGNSPNTFPVLPREVPVIALTMSPLRIFIPLEAGRSHPALLIIIIFYEIDLLHTIMIFVNKATAASNGIHTLLIILLALMK